MTVLAPQLRNNALTQAAWDIEDAAMTGDPLSRVIYLDRALNGLTRSGLTLDDFALIHPDAAAEYEALREQSKDA